MFPLTHLALTLLCLRLLLVGVAVDTELKQVQNQSAQRCQGVDENIKVTSVSCRKMRDIRSPKFILADYCYFSISPLDNSPRGIAHQENQH